MVIEYLLGGSCYAEHFTYISSFHPHPNPRYYYVINFTD